MTNQPTIEGVSFYNEVTSILISTPQDTIDTVPQFLSRNRNKITKGIIICTLKEFNPNIIYDTGKLLNLHQYYDNVGKTRLHNNEEETIQEHRKNLLLVNCIIPFLIFELYFHSMNVTQIKESWKDGTEEDAEIIVLTKEMGEFHFVNQLQYIHQYDYEIATSILNMLEGIKKPDTLKDRARLHSALHLLKTNRNLQILWDTCIEDTDGTFHALVKVYEENELKGIIKKADYSIKWIEENLVNKEFAKKSEIKILTVNHMISINLTKLAQSKPELYLEGQGYNIIGEQKGKERKRIYTITK